jgi:predicted secreted protein
MAVTSRTVGRALALLLCGVLLCRAGVGAEEKDKTKDEKGKAEKSLLIGCQGVLLTQKDNGAKVTLRGTEHLVVQLKFAAGTAYHWKLKKPCKELKEKEHCTLRPAKAKPGSPNFAAFTYQAQGVGKCHLEYDLVDSKGKVAKAVKYAIEVLPLNE